MAGEGDKHTGKEKQNTITKVAQQWPTPTSGDSKASGSAAYATTPTHQQGTTLTDATVRQPLWATPRTITGGGESAKRKQELGRAESGGGDLQSQSQNWATPSANDWKGSSRPGQRRGQLSEQTEPSSRLVPATLTDGDQSSPTVHTSRLRLNPAFAAWVMGLPWWWTHPERTNCDASEMASYRYKLRSLLDTYCPESEHMNDE
jgi:hypothetical protein